MKPAMVAVIVVAALLAGAHAEIKELSCMKTGNRDVSQCLFDGDNCNFVTDFANFANEWVSHRDWEANPVPGPNAVFVVESDVAPALDPSGALYMQVLQDRAGVQGNGTILSTTRSLKYGVVEATFKQSGVPGVVSSFILASNDLDEIDLEITGADLYNVNSNWYYRGKELLNAQGQNVNGYSYWTNDNNADVYHTYRIDWNAERIQWAINGVVFKTALANETTGYGFPSSPARISFGVWQTPFTSTWAGKGDPTTVPNPLPHVYFKSIKVSCAAANGPAATPAPVQPRAAPTPGGAPGSSSGSSPSSPASSAAWSPGANAIGTIAVVVAAWLAF